MTFNSLLLIYHQSTPCLKNNPVCSTFLGQTEKAGALRPRSKHMIPMRSWFVSINGLHAYYSMISCMIEIKPLSDDFYLDSQFIAPLISQGSATHNSVQCCMSLQYRVTGLLYWVKEVCPAGSKCMPINSVKTKDSHSCCKPCYEGKQMLKDNELA